MLGCASLRRMHTSRSTLRALSGLLSTSPMRFSATCSTTAGGAVKRHQLVLLILHERQFCGGDAPCCGTR